MATVNFEKAFADTVKAIENRGFKLPPDIENAVVKGLATAREIYLSGELEQFSGDEYRHRLLRAFRNQLGYRAAPPKALNGYRIVERLLSYYCQMQLGDRSQQQRSDVVLHRLQVQVASKPQVFRDVADLYIKAYRELAPIDLFNTEGHPIGRAAKAAKKVAMQFTGQRKEKMVRVILTDLRRLVQEIDRGLNN